ncbi:hypothetical protein WN51_07131, partial [Melipona quadrifasciata]
RSPDLTSCDFFLWRYLKEQVFQTPIDNTDELRRRIIIACKTISPETLAEVENNFLKRLQRHIMNDSGYVEG